MVDHYKPRFFNIIFVPYISPYQEEKKPVFEHASFLCVLFLAVINST